MFLLGLVVTAVTMSVSVSVGILVPLSARGYIRRENLIPYMLGANISTLVDTLAAGVLLGDPRATSVVLVHMVSGILVSLPIVLLIYHPYERGLSRALAWVTRNRRHFRNIWNLFTKRNFGRFKKISVSQPLHYMFNLLTASQKRGGFFMNFSYQ